MNIYLISQEINFEYDTYDSAVVCAPDEATAKMIHPSGNVLGTNKYDEFTWCSPEHVKVVLIGTAVPNSLQGVICASFNAG